MRHTTVQQACYSPAPHPAAVTDLDYPVQHRPLATAMPPPLATSPPHLDSPVQRRPPATAMPPHCYSPPTHLDYPVQRRPLATAMPPPCYSPPPTLTIRFSVVHLRARRKMRMSRKQRRTLREPGRELLAGDSSMAISTAPTMVTMAAGGRGRGIQGLGCRAKSAGAEAYRVLGVGLSWQGQRYTGFGV